ncbi:MAG: hypothetical protein JW829_05285 [Pirellulales bacterium]|nr:hypothetical protein [Pirellulales bacterium]
MNEDPLTSLLQEADAAWIDAMELPDSVPSAAALRAAAARRSSRRRRMAGIGITTMVAAWIVFALSIRGDRGAHIVRHEPHESTPRIDVEQIRSEVAELETEAQLLLHVVEGLRQAAVVNRAKNELARLRSEIDPCPRLRYELDFQCEVDRSAIVSLTFAARLAEDLADPLAAAKAYRRVAERFPNTPWAVAANEGLAQIGKAM